MSEKEKMDFERWSNAWRDASRAMGDERRNRISDPGYYQKNLKILDEMLQYASTRCKTRLTSGLIEMQRIFSRQKP